MHVPTASRRRRTTRCCRYVTFFSARPKSNLACLSLTRRIIVPDDPTSRRGHPYRVVQAYCPFGRIINVPRIPIASRERDEATVPHARTGWRRQPLKGESSATSVRSEAVVASGDQRGKGLMTELQNQNRRSTSSKTHGLPRRCRLGRYHERQGSILGDKGRMGGTGYSGA